MRKKLVTIVAVTGIGLSGLAVSGTALAGTTEGGTAPGTTATSAIDRIKQALSGLVSDKTLTQAQADRVASTLSDAGIGRGGHGGRGGPGGFGGPGRDLGAAATALGMSEADLRTALQSGKSLAAVAKEKNVSVDTLVSALVASAQERIAAEVTSGRLPQAQADERLKDLRQRITDRVNAVRPPRPAEAPDGGTPAPSTSPSGSSSGNSSSGA